MWTRFPNINLTSSLSFKAVFVALNERAQNDIVHTTD
jgi:hypothetical protein